MAVVIPDAGVLNHQLEQIYTVAHVFLAELMVFFIRVSYAVNNDSTS